MGLFEKSWREACHRLTWATWTWDMGHGTTRQTRQQKDLGVGRDVQSIIIIWRLIWCMCAQGPTSTTVLSTSGESGKSAGTVIQHRPLPDFNQPPIQTPAPADSNPLNMKGFSYMPCTRFRTLLIFRLLQSHECAGVCPRPVQKT